MGIRIFLTVDNAVEVIQRWVLSDDAALRKYRIFVLDKAERFGGMILFDIVGRCKKLIKFRAADRAVSKKAWVIFAKTLPQVVRVLRCELHRVLLAFLIQVFHQLRANAKPPEQTCIVHLQPRRGWSIQTAQLLNLCKESLDNAECQLRLLFENIVGDVNEATMKKNAYTVISQLRQIWADAKFVLGRWLEPDRPYSYPLLQHFTEA